MSLMLTDYQLVPVGEICVENIITLKYGRDKSAHRLQLISNKLAG